MDFVKSFIKLCLMKKYNVKKHMEAELPHFFHDITPYSDAGDNRRVLIDAKYWDGPKLIPKFWQRSKVKQWQYYQNHSHRKNDIKTAKYGITFPIVNLFYQFQRLANAYFLFMVILQCIDVISSGMALILNIVARAKSSYKY